MEDAVLDEIPVALLLFAGIVEAFLISGSPKGELFKGVCEGLESWRDCLFGFELIV